MILAVLVQSGGFGLGSLGSIGQLGLPVLFIAAMYFLMIAPNQKKQKAWAQMLGRAEGGRQGDDQRGPARDGAAGEG